MALALTRNLVRDFVGKAGEMSYLIDSASGFAGAEALATALDALTDAGMYDIKLEMSSAVVVGAFTSTPYSSPSDKAVMEFVDDTGGFHHYQIPEPLETIFLPDKENVDPADTLVAAFIAAIVANAKSESGGALSFLRGYRVRAKNRKTNLKFGAS